MQRNKYALYKRKIVLILVLAIIVIGFLLPQQFQIPVANAGKTSYDQKSFWYYPWGKSGTHKGVDIFAPESTPVYPATNGIVVYKGPLERGGNV